MLFCIEVGRCVNGNIPNFKVVKSIMNIMEYKQRIAITENLRTGKIPRKIIMFFRYPKSTTYMLLRDMRLQKNSNRVPSKEETREAPELVQKVQEFILENLETLIRKLTAVLKENCSNVRRIVEEDLRYI